MRTRMSGRMAASRSILPATRLAVFMFWCAKKPLVCPERIYEEQRQTKHCDQKDTEPGDYVRQFGRPGTIRESGRLILHHSDPPAEIGFHSVNPKHKQGITQRPHNLDDPS